jgi:4-amino-4-deoxy-L-arabinose transferase-like glycosyltransferase
MCSWSLQERNARWCLAAGIFAALALLTRGLVGIGLLLIFAIDWSIHRRIPRRHLFLTGVITVLPLAAWYAYLLVRHPQFAAIHQGWLEREVFGPLVPPWRRYTGAIEYAYMLLKSYWPWLPAMVAGIVLTIRQRRRELYSLVIWGAVVFFLCAVTRSRVLRYLLPAYPAFAILSAGAISKFARRSVLEAFMNWATAGAVCTALAIVWFWHPNWQAGEIRPIARAASEPPGQAVAFYDAGQPRYDEANQLEWYGDCVPRLLTSADLNQALRDRAIRAFVIDRGTYEKLFRQIPHSSVVESGHLVYARVQPPGAPPPYQ